MQIVRRVKENGAMKGFDVLLSERLEARLCEGRHQETVFEALYQDFVLPNAEKFRQNYSVNSCLENGVGYEECALDFIPIADREYFILDKDSAQLCGTFAANPYEEDERTERTFTSILIADYGDIREIMPIVLQKRWQNVYIVLNAGLRRFASFFKLEEFPGVLPQNTKIFATTEDFRRYFLEDHDAYLPRKVFSPEPEKYDAVIEELHDARVQSGVPSENVFLSICIPSFNRGHRALQAVRHALTACYDAEIEIVLVNTGSTVRTEGYQEIKNMADSRLRYYELEKNEGFHLSYRSSLSRANGHFAMMLSDEDLLALENLDTIFEYLYLHQMLGATTFDGIAEGELPPGLVREPKIYKKGVEGIKWAFDWIRYISGNCINCDCLKKDGILEKIEEKYLAEPFFLLSYNYIHCVVGLLLANKHEVTNSGIEGWYYGEPAYNLRTIIDWDAPHSFFPKSRLAEERSAMNLLGDMLCGHDLDEMFDYEVNATFNIISLNYKDEIICPKDQLDSLYCWPNIWRAHYENCLQILQDLEGKFGDVSAVKAKMDKSFLYWQICKRAQRRHTPEENLMPSLQAQVAKYYHEKGVPFEKIDFDGIEKDLEGWVQSFLAERS